MTARQDTASAAPLLEATGIEFSYGRVQVLFGVSVSVARGEALALLGTNGAGKSTLLRVIAGLAAPSKGAVVFDGDDITGHRADQLVRRGLLLISGGRSVFPDMSIDENLELQALTVRSKPEWLAERRAQVYELFPALATKLRERAGNLSGGQQQQLALAKAILLEPTVLCVDELSLGLAPVVVQELIEVVRGLSESGITIVLVEQSLNIASQLCDRAVFMEKGAVRFEGRTVDLLERDDVARAVFLGGNAEAHQ
jgi:ABC-type branched-subunit amino acid transport system ATPase component